MDLEFWVYVAGVVVVLGWVAWRVSRPEPPPVVKPLSEPVSEPVWPQYKMGWDLAFEDRGGLGQVLFRQDEPGGPWSIVKFDEENADG